MSNRKMDLDEIILASLRSAKNSQYVSGEELCKAADVSRAAVWKHIKLLREEGYEIEASPHHGYRLISAPDRLSKLEIKWGMKVHRIGNEIIAYNKVDSTNDIAYQLSQKGINEGCVVIAEEQSRGKGRHGRVWNSPPKSGIYMSVVLRPKMPPSQISRITLLAAVSAAKAIRGITGLDARIKWPNDILINGKKVCGILTEMKAEQDIIEFIIIGIGINVNGKKNCLPAGASSLAEEAGNFVFSRIDLARSLIENLDHDYLILKKNGFEPIIEEWKSFSGMLGSRVKVILPNTAFEGIAHYIDPDGALIVRKDAGVLERVSSGDVLMLRQGS